MRINQLHILVRTINYWHVFFKRNIKFCIQWKHFHPSLWYIEVILAIPLWPTAKLFRFFFFFLGQVFADGIELSAKLRCLGHLTRFDTFQMGVISHNGSSEHKTEKCLSEIDFFLEDNFSSWCIFGEKSSLSDRHSLNQMQFCKGILQGY